MASPSTSSLALILLTLFPCILLTLPQTQAQKAPAPAPAGPLNLTAILEKAGQYTTFMRLLNITQVDNQIQNQINNSGQGMTVFAPTDNAFNNLKAGTLNDLSMQQQVDLVLYHVLPKYYSLVMFQTVSNPVRTQSSSPNGAQYGINITSTGNQVNVSSGSIVTQLNNVLNKDFPLAVYELDQVLLPKDKFQSNTTDSPSPLASPAKKAPSSVAKEPSADGGDSNSGSKGRNVGLGMIVGACLIFFGLF